MAITRAQARAAAEAKAAPKAKAAGKKRSSNNPSSQIKALKSAPGPSVTTKDTELTARAAKSVVIPKGELKSTPAADDIKPAFPPTSTPADKKPATNSRAKTSKASKAAPASASASTWHNAPDTSIALPDDPTAPSIAAAELFVSKRKSSGATRTSARIRRRMTAGKWLQFTAMFPEDPASLARLERWRKGARCHHTDVLWASYQAYCRAEESPTVQSEAVTAGLRARLSAARKAWTQEPDVFDCDLGSGRTRAASPAPSQPRKAQASRSNLPNWDRGTVRLNPDTNKLEWVTSPHTRTRVGTSSAAPDLKPLLGLDPPHVPVPLENPGPLPGLDPFHVPVPFENPPFWGTVPLENPAFWDTIPLENPVFRGIIPLKTSSDPTLAPYAPPTPIPDTYIPEQTMSVPLPPTFGQLHDVSAGPASSSGSASVTEPSSESAPSADEPSGKLDAAAILSSIILPTGEIDPAVLAAFAAHTQKLSPRPGTVMEDPTWPQPQLQAQFLVHCPSDVTEPEPVWDMDEGVTEATLFDWDMLGMSGKELALGLGMEE